MQAHPHQMLHFLIIKQFHLQTIHHHPIFIQLMLRQLQRHMELTVFRQVIILQELSIHLISTDCRQWI